MLDPAANPSLFHSMLMIIIKVASCQNISSSILTQVSRMLWMLTKRILFESEMIMVYVNCKFLTLVEGSHSNSKKLCKMSKMQISSQSFTVANLPSSHGQ